MKRLKAFIADVIENLKGLKLLAVAARKRARYIGQVFSFWWHGPRVILTQQQGIQNVDQAVGILQGRIAELQQRIRHHEQGPLMASARTLQGRKQRMANLEARAAQAKTREEHDAVAREAAQLQSELEADSMPSADAVIDAASGQVSNGKMLQLPDRRIIVDEPGG